MTENSGNQAQAGQSADIRYKCGRVITADALDLVWKSWTPASPKGVIVIIHGLAEHSGRYQQTAEFLAREGWAVYAGDLRAHGLSPDIPGAGRVHVNRFTDYFLDVDALLGMARDNHAGLPLYLLGHSMGGLISISYVLAKPQGLAGAVISSPALGTHPQFKPPLFLKLMVSILSRLAPRMLIDSNLDTQAISRDPQVVSDYIDDPLVTSKVSARWYGEMMKAMKKAHKNAAGLRIPMLLMQSGADRLVDPDASAAWSRLAPKEQVELVEWERLYHEMLNEPEKDQVRARILNWLGSHPA